ncbi:MAG: CRISPR system precrRNA processing endoribonuclease RAMP protein Cas6 [Armatimonadota bacterium]|nr:CRISPR system precrRNA processing endoribonuclease RAMP protein Cas6 [Armatimonadota bacterium]MDR7528731.1 CRISPR system precrRNA processing endoribonuclease RAMP protein Cas6 [Armatimonadota bacterium]
MPLVRRRLVLEALEPLRLPKFRGALWHGVIGRALKALVCTVPPGICRECPQRGTCAYPRVMEAASPETAAGPLGHGRRIPGPLILDTGPWGAAAVEPGNLFALDFAVVDPEGALAPLVEEAVGRAAADGLGRARAVARVVASEPRPSMADELARWAGETAERLRLRLVSPLRLRRGGVLLRGFALRALARDLSLRLAALGHYHGGLPWPAPWTEALAEAERAGVAEARTRWLEGVRYSARQGREIVTGGLVGEVCLEAVGPTLRQLLAAGTVLHAGKGASMGLGRLELMT